VGPGWFVGMASSRSAVLTKTTTQHNAPKLILQSLSSGTFQRYLRFSGSRSIKRTVSYSVSCRPPRLQALTDIEFELHDPSTLGYSPSLEPTNPYSACDPDRQYYGYESLPIAHTGHVAPSGPTPFEYTPSATALQERQTSQHVGRPT
jgi:hypothetical protein